MRASQANSTSVQKCTASGLNKQWSFLLVDQSGPTLFLRMTKTACTDSYFVVAPSTGIAHDATCAVDFTETEHILWRKGSNLRTTRELFPQLLGLVHFWKLQ